VVGIFHGTKGIRFVRPLERKITKDILIPKGSEGGAKGGEVVLVRITHFGDRRVPASGSIEKVLGEVGAPGVDVLAVMHGHGLNPDCPKEVGEECDDGNGGNGDGCDEDCRPSACGNGFVGIDEDCDDGNTLDGDGCTRLCRHPEVGCDDCLDNDGNGLTDAADPNCGATVLQVKRAKVSKRGTVVVKAKTAPFDPQAGPVGLVLGDGAQTPLCTVLGPATPAGPKATVASGVLGGTLSVTLKSTGVAGVVIVKGQGLDLGTFDRKTVAVGLQIGSQRFGGQKSRGKGAKKPKP
jgi:cysteine-rich repeat protein